MTNPRPFHRTFALAWGDLFEGTSVTVEAEIDLSLKQQFLDVVLIRRGPEPVSRPLPDGFENLAAYNLITFKSFHEALDRWALCELIGHYVNYRKQSSPSIGQLLPESQYRLYAVCARFPKKLTRSTALRVLSKGVYEVRFGLPIRIVVANELPQEGHNVLLHLFGSRQAVLKYGRENFKHHSSGGSTLLKKLTEEQKEVSNMMGENLKRIARETDEELFRKLTIEDRLKGISPEELIRGLSPEAFVRAVRSLPKETQEAVIQQFKANVAAS